MSRTLCIIGTDFSGADPAWRRQPWHSLDRGNLADWRNVFYELGELARVDSIAVGIRGAFDTGAVESLSLAHAAYQQSSRQPTLMPWFDTVGLPDIVNAPGGSGVRFDFSNGRHIELAWERYARVFFDIFKDEPLERTANGRVLCAWWGIESQTGHGFTNQRHAQRLLDYIDQKCFALGLDGADHIVDKTWLELCPTLNVFAVHDWFAPWGAQPKAYSIRTHNGVTVGVTVPSFYERINPDGNADTLRDALAAMRQAQADYVLIESGTNFVEGAELMRDASGNTSKLDAVREHIELLKPSEDTIMPTLAATFCLRRSERMAHPTRSGYYTSPFPGKPDKVLSVESPNGNIAERPAGTNGAWESWREEDDRAVFDDVHGYTFAIPLVD